MSTLLSTTVQVSLRGRLGAPRPPHAIWEESGKSESIPTGSQAPRSEDAGSGTKMTRHRKTSSERDKKELPRKT